MKTTLQSEINFTLDGRRYIYTDTKTLWFIENNEHGFDTSWKIGKYANLNEATRAAKNNVQGW